MSTALLWPREFVKFAFADTAVSVQKRNLEKMLKPGDIIMMSMDPDEDKDRGYLADKVMDLYKKYGPQLQGTYGHSALYVGDGKIVESRMIEGVTLKPLSYAMKYKDILAVRPSTSIENREAAAEFATKQVGKKYDNVALAFTAAGLMLPEKVTSFLNDKFFRNRVRSEGVEINGWTCSNLVSAAYAGTDLGPVGIRLTAPVDLLESPNVVPVAKSKRRYNALLRPQRGRASS